MAVVGPGGASLTPVSVTLTPGMPVGSPAAMAATGVPGGSARVGHRDQAEAAGTQYQA